MRRTLFADWADGNCDYSSPGFCLGCRSWLALLPINGREYIDGGLVSPVPVKAARDMGADFVIAVDISYKPQYGSTYSTIDVLLQTFSIMGQSIGRYELSDADVVIRPQMSGIKATDFQDRHMAVLEGERAVAAVLAEIKAKLAKLREGR